MLSTTLHVATGHHSETSNSKFEYQPTNSVGQTETRLLGAFEKRVKNALMKKKRENEDERFHLAGGLTAAHDNEMKLITEQFQGRMATTLLLVLDSRNDLRGNSECERISFLTRVADLLDDWPTDLKELTLQVRDLFPSHNFPPSIIQIPLSTSGDSPPSSPPRFTFDHDDDESFDLSGLLLFASSSGQRIQNVLNLIGKKMLDIGFGESKDNEEKHHWNFALATFDNLFEILMAWAQVLMLFGCKDQVSFDICHDMFEQLSREPECCSTDDLLWAFVQFLRELK